MILIEFGKVYRRLDSSVRFLGSSAMNLAPTIELIDNDPQYAGTPVNSEDPPVGSYLPKKVKIFVSNKNIKPFNSSQMTLSDEIPTGVGDPTNKVNEIHNVIGTSSWILFEKENPSDNISAYTVDFFIRNSDSFNNITETEAS